MDKSREELEKEYAEATAKLEQYQHRGQRYENRIRYYISDGKIATAVNLCRKTDTPIARMIEKGI